MNSINYAVLGEGNAPGYLLPEGTERVLQMGEGNFLRAFADYFIDVANERAGWDAKVVAVQPIRRGLAGEINRQEGLYTLYLRGVERGEKREEKRVISCISRALNPYEDHQGFLDCAGQRDIRYFISNTTEAGIVFDKTCKLEDAPPASFPAKLTQLLYRRYRALGEAESPGWVILSCELIDDNGAELKRCVEEYIKLWELEDGFARWMEEKNLFCSTLVDRIVTGYPKEEAERLHRENGYEDRLLVAGETFGLWVIEGPEWLAEELPLCRAGLPVQVVGDHAPYKQRKVRILNGGHTCMVPAAFLAGKNLVRDCMDDPVIVGFLDRALQHEIIPTLDLPADDLNRFAASVLDRFRNPFIDHSLLSITLNSVSKWRARVLPSVKGYLGRFGKLPPCLTFGFAAQLAFFRGGEMGDGALIGTRGAETYPIRDDASVLDFLHGVKDCGNKEYVQAVCSNRQFWGEDLTGLPGFARTVTEYMDRMDDRGVYAAMEECLDAGER